MSKAIAFIQCPSLVGRCAVAFVIAFHFFAPVKSAQSAQSAQSAKTRHVPGRVLLKFKENVSRDRRRQLISQASAREVNELAALGIHILALPPRADDAASLAALR